MLNNVISQEIRCQSAQAAHPPHPQASTQQTQPMTSHHPQASTQHSTPTNTPTPSAETAQQPNITEQAITLPVLSQIQEHNTPISHDSATVHTHPTGNDPAQTASLNTYKVSPGTKEVNFSNSSHTDNNGMQSSAPTEGDQLDGTKGVKPQHVNNPPKDDRRSSMGGTDIIASGKGTLPHNSWTKLKSFSGIADLWGINIDSYHYY